MDLATEVGVKVHLEDHDAMAHDQKTMQGNVIGTDVVERLG